MTIPLFSKNDWAFLKQMRFFGLVLVVLMLLLFIGWRNALFAALGIPVAFMATFWFMSIAGYTLSGVSLFGLILVVGIVVDDAIVVTENIYRHIEAGESPKVAAIRGAEEVGWPVVAASLTTICAFGPLMFMSGVTGQFMRIVPVMAILVLIASLFEVFVILPAHVAEWGRTKIRTGRSRLENLRTESPSGFTLGVRIVGFFVWFAMFFELIRNRYVRILKITLRHRYAFVGSVLFFGVVACIGAFFILDRELFPGEEFPQFYVQAEMPPSYGIQETTEVIVQIEEMAKGLPSTEVDAVVSNVGLHTFMSGLVRRSVTYGSNLGEVIVELTPKQERTRGVDDIIAELRTKTTAISGIERLSFVTQDGGGTTSRRCERQSKRTEI